MGFGGESVFRSVGIGKPGNLAYYNYFYDAERRRVAKERATGAREHCHDSPAREMLADVGYSESCTAPGGFCRAEDDYIWLGGKPVVQLRSMTRNMGSNVWVPVPDGTGTCPRYGETASCDTYFVVTDQVNRPVLMLNHALQVSGTGEYEPYGALNRVHRYVESAHPYTGAGDTVWTTLGRPQVSGLTTQMRVHLPLLDVMDGGYVRVEDTDGGALSVKYVVRQSSDKWGEWVTQPGGRQPRLHFHWVNPGANTPSGFAMTEYEYRRYQTTNPLWTNLRGAGQYYDRETDMFENWNRYYDSATGRYLSAEPMLRDQRWLAALARTGESPATYVYVNGSPVLRTDSSGNQRDQADAQHNEADVRCIPCSGSSYSPLDARRGEFCISLAGEGNACSYARGVAALTCARLGESNAACRCATILALNVCELFTEGDSCDLPRNPVASP